NRTSPSDEVSQVEKFPTSSKDCGLYRVNLCIKASQECRDNNHSPDGRAHSAKKIDVVKPPATTPKTVSNSKKQ
ncbi:MAG: hypothetical protein WAW91_01130, partial [Candidatus Nanoperiomorbaceae bacterium]